MSSCEPWMYPRASRRVDFIVEVIGGGEPRSPGWQRKIVTLPKAELQEPGGSVECQHDCRIVAELHFEPNGFVSGSNEG